VTWEQSGDSLLTSHTDECHGLAGGIQRFSIAPAISPTQPPFLNPKYSLGARSALGKKWRKRKRQQKRDLSIGFPQIKTR